jgi:hypothetical protein
MKKIPLIIFVFVLFSCISIAAPSISYYNVQADEAVNSTNANWTINASGTNMDFNTSFFSAVGKELILAYDFNVENATDLSGNGNHGTVTGATWNATGGFDGSGTYEFNGINQYLNSTLNIILSNHSYSICFWFDALSHQTDYSVLMEIEQNGGVANNNGTGIRTYSNKLYYRLDTSNSSSYSIPLTSPEFNDTWWHHCLIYNQSSSYISTYHNGAYYTGGLVPGYWTMTTPRFFIGSTYSNFNGTIDDVRIYDYALSPEQISDLYNNTVILRNAVTSVNETWTACTASSDGSDYDVECKDFFIRGTCPGVFACSSYYCTVNNTDMCVGATDTSGCEQTYTGNYSEFELICTYCEESLNKDSIDCDSYKMLKEVKMIPIAIIVIGLLFWLIYTANNLNIKDKEGNIVPLNALIKTVMYWFSFFIFFVSVQVALGKAIDDGISTITSTMNVLYQFTLYVGVLLLVLVLIGTIGNVGIGLVNWLKDNYNPRKSRAK